MKIYYRTLFYFFLIILCNYLTLKYAYTQDTYRFIGLFGFLVGIYSIFQFSISFAGLFTKRTLKYHEIYSDKSLSDSNISKHLLITVSSLVVIIGFNIMFQVKYSNHLYNKLVNDGSYVKAIVTDKKWERRGRWYTEGNYIYYSFTINENGYEHSTKSEDYTIGDTLLIRYLPDNPDNHEIVQIKK